jgi:hypothetical protein
MSAVFKILATASCFFFLLANTCKNNKSLIYSLFFLIVPYRSNILAVCFYWWKECPLPFATFHPWCDPCVDEPSHAVHDDAAGAAAESQSSGTVDELLTPMLLPHLSLHLNLNQQVALLVFTADPLASH